MDPQEERSLVGPPRPLDDPHLWVMHWWAQYEPQTEQSPAEAYLSYSLGALAIFGMVNDDKKVI